jgi:aerobic-type carbon monoxide dehydrogenase small subunit (CoxS/CutS family)
VVDLVVNGQRWDLAGVAESTPLLWALRDRLGLLAAKYGCGLEQCGACMVLVDGVARPSCRLPLADVAGQQVTTLEALRDDPEGRRVVDALLAANAAQCGYCLPGIAVTLTWLVRRGPAGWDEAVRALDDHLCRCGSHPRILRVARQLLSAPPVGAGGHADGEPA